jgi:DivIVA domain-containing protein
MSCRECAAEVAVTARVCSRCGAPVVGQQPPVVADTVTDTVVGAFSDAAGKVVPAGVAGQAPPEPYVPGSGARVPAELRLVLGGYAGIACGLFAGGLACGVAAVLVFFFAADIDTDPDMIEFLIFMISYLIAVAGVVCICGLLGLSGALDTLQACIRFSRLLRQPSDPRTATVTASERGGRTLRLDIIPRDSTGRGYQPLSEVRLALWTKAGMLVPGETVEIYAEHRPAHMGPGGSGKSPLLVSSPQRGRAFLGTAKSATVQPGPVTSLDEKVSGATLVDWAAWAASTTFSSTGLRFGHDKREVDAFRSAVRDTLLGVSRPAVRSDDLRGKQFSTHRPGYNKKQVAAFLEAAGLRLAAMESTDRPAGPLVSGALLVAWAEWADSTTFSWRMRGYQPIEVDNYLDAIRDTFIGASQPPVRAENVRGKQFPSTHHPHAGYDKKQVAAFLDAAGIRLAAMESTDRPAGPLVSDAILAEWAEWADSTRFSTTAHLLQGYDTADVDAFREELRDTFLGVRQPPVVSGHVRGKQFSTHRPGYDKTPVDAFTEKAAWRLAAMESTDKPQGPLVSWILAEWAEWADSTRFETTRPLGEAYDAADGGRRLPGRDS